MSMSTKMMRRIRENHGLTHEEFAEMLGVPAERYKKAEAQTCNIPREFEIKVNNIVDKIWGRKRR